MELKLSFRNRKTFSFSFIPCSTYVSSTNCYRTAMSENYSITLQTYYINHNHMSKDYLTASFLFCTNVYAIWIPYTKNYNLLLLTLYYPDDWISANVLLQCNSHCPQPIQTLHWSIKSAKTCDSGKYVFLNMSDS